jgi:alpha-tubulin suppressor-like RCC1 family protein
MSTLKTNSVQFGHSNTASDNFIMNATTSGELNITRGDGTPVLDISADDIVSFQSQVEIIAATTKATIVKITRGYHCFHAYTSDNRVFGWGYNNIGQVGDGSTSNSPLVEILFPATALADGATIVDMTCSTNTIYVLFSNGQLYGWGNNGFGQLGLGDTTNRSFPTWLNSNVAEMWYSENRSDYPWSAHTRVNVFLKKTNGTIWSCGYNAEGSLALGDTTNRTSWTQIPPPTGKTISKIWVSERTLTSTWCKTTDNLIFACGYNDTGQLGLGDTTQRNSWSQVNYFNNIPDVIDIESKGYWYNGTTSYHFGWTAVLTASGDVYTSGNNYHGQLGDGTTTQRTSFAKVVLTKPVKSIHVTRCSIFTHFTDNNYARWGENGVGQLHDGTTVQKNSPIYGTMTVSKIFLNQRSGNYAEYQCLYMLGTDNILYACGDGWNGQLGYGSTGTTNHTTLRLTLFNTSNGIKDILITGDAHVTACILPENSDRVYCAGYNVNAELGYLPDGGNKPTFRPLVLT